MDPSRFFFSIHGLVLNYKLKSAASSTSKENRLLIISRLFILRFTRCNNPMPGALEGTAVDDDRSVWTTHCSLVSVVRTAKRSKCPKMRSVPEA